MKGGSGTGLVDALSTGQFNSIHPGWFIALAMIFALVPLLMGLFTAYLKVSVVLGMIRSALGTQHTPSGLVVMALSVAITGYAMAPVIDESIRAFPTQDVRRMSVAELQQSGLRILTPLQEFLRRHAGERELHALRTLQRSEGDERSERRHEVSATNAVDDVPLSVLLPAFVLTEIKEAFAMGFVVLLPFLVIDLIVANLLVGMGMTMVSPIMVALPVKILLFVVSDAWLLITRGLVQSYQ